MSNNSVTARVSVPCFYSTRTNTSTRLTCTYRRIPLTHDAHRVIGHCIRLADVGPFLPNHPVIAVARNVNDPARHRLTVCLLPVSPTNKPCDVTSVWKKKYAPPPMHSFDPVRFATCMYTVNVSRLSCCINTENNMLA